jgi:hypothetical protein
MDRKLHKKKKTKTNKIVYPSSLKIGAKQRWEYERTLVPRMTRRRTKMNGSHSFVAGPSGHCDYQPFVLR